MVAVEQRPSTEEQPVSVVVFTHCQVDKIFRARGSDLWGAGPSHMGIFFIYCCS